MIQRLACWTLARGAWVRALAGSFQQQQQQHTLLTFPKGAFQRQCYKNNPITIKKSYLQLKMF